MNDFGIPFLTACFLSNTKGYFPEEEDVYSPYEPNYGNSRYGNPGQWKTLDWGTVNNN
jgi:hypothetical protein